MINEHNLKFDVAFTSVLKRAIKTLYLIQDGCDMHWIPVHRHWRLNERMYGALQGLSKSETAKKHGEEQVKVPLSFYSGAPLLLILRKLHTKQIRQKDRQIGLARQKDRTPRTERIHSLLEQHYVANSQYHIIPLRQSKQLITDQKVRRCLGIRGVICPVKSPSVHRRNFREGSRPPFLEVKSIHNYTQSTEISATVRGH